MSLKKYICQLKQHKRFNNVAYVIVAYEDCIGLEIPSQLSAKGTIDGIPFQKTLALIGNNEYVLVVNQQMLDAIQKGFGEFVEILIEKNITKEVSLEDTFLSTLKTFPLAFSRFNKMPQNYKNEYIDFLRDSVNSDIKHKELSQLSKIKNLIEMFNN